MDEFMSPIFILAMTKSAGRALQGAIHNQDMVYIIHADGDLIRSIIFTDRWISNSYYKGPLPKEGLNEFIDDSIQNRRRVVDRYGAMSKFQSCLKYFCQEEGFLDHGNFGFLWEYGNAVSESTLFHELVKALVSIFPACQILLVTDSAEDCAERIMEDWARFLEVLAIDSPELAAAYADLQPGARRVIALNWSMAQKAVIDSLHGFPNCISIPSVLINRDPQAALSLANVID